MGIINFYRYSTKRSMQDTSAFEFGSQMYNKRTKCQLHKTRSWEDNRSTIC